jgi:hypothetical protein
MEFRLFQSTAALGSLVLTALVLELIRRRKLQDELWLPWLGVAVLPLVLSIWVEPWAVLARWLGVVYEPALLLALGILLSISMVLHLTVVISSLIRRNLRLAQEVALLDARVQELADALNPRNAPQLGAES